MAKQLLNLRTRVSDDVFLEICHASESFVTIFTGEGTLSGVNKEMRAHCLRVGEPSSTLRADERFFSGV